LRYREKTAKQLKPVNAVKAFVDVLGAKVHVIMTR